jgi:hypothetical protein
MVDFSVYETCLCVGLFGLVFYAVRNLFSPLSQIPNAHFTSPWTSLWIQWMRYKGREIQSIHAAYQKKGRIVRLGPNEIAVNLVPGGITTIYGARGFDKTEWYDFYINHG